MTNRTSNLVSKLRDAKWRYHPESALAVMLTAAADELERLQGLETNRTYRWNPNEVGMRPVETSALPHASAALKDFMAHLGEIMSMEDGATPADYLQRARDIREWCHDHQTLPELEYSEHCGCCVRNKITVEVFGRPAVEPTPVQLPCTLTKGCWLELGHDGHCD